MSDSLYKKIAEMFNIDIKKARQLTDSLSFSEYMEALAAVKSNDINAIRGIFKSAGIELEEATVDLASPSQPNNQDATEEPSDEAINEQIKSIKRMAGLE